MRKLKVFFKHQGLPLALYGITVFVLSCNMILFSSSPPQPSPPHPPSPPRPPSPFPFPTFSPDDSSFQLY